MSEESLIKRKLLLDGDGTGEDKRLQVFIKQLATWIHSKESATKCETAYNNLMAQLHYIKLNRKKFDLSMQSNLQQMEKFQAIQESFQARRLFIIKDIEHQKNLLKRAKIVKKYRIEYNLMVKTLNQEPCRKELTGIINKLKKEILNLEKEKENFSLQLNNKVKQCQVLSISANTLKYVLKNQNGDDSALSPTNSLVSDLNMDWEENI